MKRLAVLLLGALVLAACAAGPSGSTVVPVAPSFTGSTDQAASAQARGKPIVVKDFTLVPKDVTVTGSTELDVTNEGPTIHNVTIRDPSGAVLGATKDLRTGESDALRFTLPAGTYTLFCSLPGHESLGIKGTLVVTD